MGENMAKHTTVPDAGALVVLPPAQPLRYVGAGEYIYGVPARDLNADEAAQYAAQIVATATATGRVLYAPVAKEE